MSFMKEASLNFKDIVNSVTLNLALKCGIVLQGDRVDVKSVVPLLVRAGHPVALKTLQVPVQPQTKVVPVENGT